MTVNDALTNEALENVTATILRLDDGEEQVYSQHSRLFRFQDGRWRERGLGKCAAC